MTESTELPAECQTVRDELPGLLYDDLDADTRQRVQHHLESCPACAAELEELRRTVDALDAWSVIPTRRTRPRLARAARRGLAAWLRPVSIGAAAALIPFTALILLGTDVHYADGRLVVSIGRGDGAPGAPEIDLDAVAAVSRRVAAQEANARYGALLDALEERLADLENRAEDRRLLLAKTVDLCRDEDRRQQLAMIRALSQHLESEMLRTHEAIDDVRGRMSADGRGL
jgi:hypothetical protein